MELPYIGRGVDKGSFERIVNSVLFPGETLIAVFNGVQEYSDGERLSPASALEFFCITDRNIRYTMGALFKQRSLTKPWSEVTGVSEVYGIFRGAIMIHLGSMKLLRFGEMTKDDVRIAKELIEWGMQGFPQSNKHVSLFENRSQKEGKSEMKYSQEELTAIIMEFVDMAPADRREYAIQYADVLLSDATDYVLGQIALRMPVVPAAEVNLLREILQQSRRIGIVSSFSDHESRRDKLRIPLSEFVWESSLPHKKNILKNTPDILADIGLAVLNRLVIGAEIHNEAKDVFVYSQHLVLLVKCRQYGIENAFQEIFDGRDDYWAL
jgi:hypothetical protein